MAAEKARIDTKLQIVMTAGETEAGKPAVKTFTFSRIWCGGWQGVCMTGWPAGRRRNDG